MRAALLVFVGLMGLGSTGCYVSGTTRVHYVQPSVYVDSPELVYVDDVYVVRDYDYACYYVDGYYYSYRGGVWYSTASWGGSWVVVHDHYVPAHLYRRDHSRYAHYHGGPGARTWRAPSRGRDTRDHRASRPEQRDVRERDTRSDNTQRTSARPEANQRVDSDQSSSRSSASAARNPKERGPSSRVEVSQASAQRSTSSSASRPAQKASPKAASKTRSRR